MRVIKGRGNNREIFDVPCAEVVKRSPVHHQKQAVRIICTAAGISV